jgi:hypothetical protein
MDDTSALQVNLLSGLELGRLLSLTRMRSHHGHAHHYRYHEPALLTLFSNEEACNAFSAKE